MAKGKYSQMKAWPTRRIHLFVSKDRSLCGCVMFLQCFPMTSGLNYVQLSDYHEYDNLNFCQSCLRVAMADNKAKYVPIKQYYYKKYGVSNGAM